MQICKCKLIKSEIFYLLKGYREKLEQVPLSNLLQGFEISRAFLRAKQVGAKRGKIINFVKIIHKAVVLIFPSL